MSEEQADYVTEAMEMMGTGYEHPSVEIEMPRTVLERRQGKLREVDKPAFVKISTAFKDELERMSGDALKVWLFVSLSINRYSGRANPSLRTISKRVNLAVNTVQKALAELENLGLLAVDRETTRYNIYEVPEYVSANRADPIVSNGDTDDETVSNFDETVSNPSETVSPSVILNQINQSNQIDPAFLEKASLEWTLASGEKTTQEQVELANLKETAPRMFEHALGFTKSLPWWSGKDWDEFSDWVCQEYKRNPRSFGEYNIWRNTKYAKGGITNTRLRGFPLEFFDSWDMFQMANKPIQDEEKTRLI